MEKITFDARGMACPLPVVNAKKKSEEMQQGGSLTILVDNEIAVQNLLKFAASRGFEAVSSKENETNYSVTMEVTACSPISSEASVCNPDARRQGTVVVLSGNTMGTGDEKLGKALMKAFIFALTKQDILPETILCYNSGAYLTCTGSDFLEDLNTLEAQGVKIMTCGTCLDFYNLKEQLQIGTVTNMYEIVETMEKAGSIIRP